MVTLFYFLASHCFLLSGLAAVMSPPCIAISLLSTACAHQAQSCAAQAQCSHITCFCDSAASGPTWWWKCPGKLSPHVLAVGFCQLDSPGLAAVPTLTTFSFVSVEALGPYQDAPLGTPGHEAPSSQMQESHLFLIAQLSASGNTLIINQMVESYCLSSTLVLMLFGVKPLGLLLSIARTEHL